MPVLGYEMASQELCPMYNAVDYMMGAQPQWEKHASTPYYGPVVRSPPQEARPVMTFSEGLLTSHSKITFLVFAHYPFNIRVTANCVQFGKEIYDLSAFKNTHDD